jgi:hypothetical protein
MLITLNADVVGGGCVVPGGCGAAGGIVDDPPEHAAKEKLKSDAAISATPWLRNLKRTMTPPINK